MSLNTLKKLAGRRAATLLELLVVIVIMTILAATAIPVIAPAIANRQVREASRMVNIFINGAHTRAMQSGRPVGVVLDRMVGLPEACVALSYAEVPPPYAGDSINSTIQIKNGAVYALWPAVDMAGNVYSQDVGWINTIRINDLLRLNYQGAYFQIGRPLNSNAYNTTTLYFTTDPATNATPSYAWPLSVLPGANGTLPADGIYRYQIIRAPIKLAAGGIQMPGPTVIDLTCSGFDLLDAPISPNPNSFANAWCFQPYTNPNLIPAPPLDTTPVIITFAPSGAMDTVWCWPYPNQTFISNHASVPTATKPLTAVHLMVGRREVLPWPSAPPQNRNPNDPNFVPYLNWQDPGNFWVSINPQTGLITTVEVNISQTATNNGTYGDNLYPSGTAGQQGVGYGTYTELLDSRIFALESLRTGGR